MAATKPIYVEVEESDNSYAMPMQLFEARAEPVPVENVRLFEPGRPHGVYEVTGWSSEDDGSPCPATYVPVSDSGQAEAHLIIGGDWGVRMRPLDSSDDWDIDNPEQWGEPFLWLSDRADVIV